MTSPDSTAIDVEERTGVIYGSESIINDTLERLYAAKESVDNCIDSTAPSPFTAVVRHCVCYQYI
jgi:hypothetical protein